MKEPRTVTVEEAVAHLERFDAILDARSPSEHAEDHLPGAMSTPVLDDAQRASVGTLYKQAGTFEAKRVGAALVSRNIADILDRQLQSCGRDWKPLVYCWRGGNRSGALATVMARIGWHTSVLEGGYREFRRRVISDLHALPARLRFVVVAGRTGSGKSLMLERAAALGAQVLDLEQLARHRGSVLGHLPDCPQPSQRRFETLIWERLRSLDPARPVLVESESRKVGQCQVPEQLILAMRASACVVIDTPDDVRVALLVAEYDHFVQDSQRLQPRMEALVPHLGRRRVDDWMELARARRWPEFVTSVLHEHYDPAYDRSMKRNFQRLEEAASVQLRGADTVSLDEAARRLVALAR